MALAPAKIILFHLQLWKLGYHKAPVIITSQVEPQGWLKLFEDPVIAEAIVDRLIHPSQKITLKGEKSYREKLAENKSRLKNGKDLS